MGQGPIKRWRPYKGEPVPFDLLYHVTRGWRVVTHGPFERIIWEYCLRPQNQVLPELRIEQTSDLMVRAFACNLPGKLEQLAKVLGLPEKDMAGHSVMMKLSKPRRIEANGTIVWWDDPTLLLAQEDYCDQDVNVERHANAVLPELTPDELELWHIDQRINDRGIPHDMVFVERAIKLVDYAKTRANEEISNLTSGAVNKATEVAKIVAWLNSRHIGATSLRKGDRQRLLDLAESADDDDAADVIELRATTGKTSTAKYRAIKTSVGSDGRGRGWLQFGGAQQTMRWAGRVVQPQNYVRVSDDEEAAIVSFVVGITSDTTRPLSEVYDMIELIGSPRLANGDKQGGLATLAWLAKSLRSTIAVSDPKRELFVGGDFSNIEGRINAWLADEQWKLQAFRDYDNHIGPDLYKLAYAKAFNIEPEQVTKPLRQIGKVIELQCGYQGGVGAFVTATQTYLLKMTSLVRAIAATTPAEVWDSVAARFPHARDKMQLDEATWTAVKVAVLGWRKSNPNIVQSWWDLQDAAIQAVDRPGTAIPVYGGRVNYFSDTQFLYCRLPSGRVLMYAQPHVMVLTEEKIFDGTQYVDVDCLFPYELDALLKSGYRVVQRSRRGVQFYGLNDVKQWTRKTLYGGYQCENIVQGTARDFLAPAIVRAEKAGYEVCLTVHDELLSLIKPNWYDRSVDHERYYQWLMTQLPAWATDFPMAASTWTGTRYVK
jgi:DNA polymerase